MVHGKQIKDTSIKLVKIDPATGQTLTLVGSSKIQQNAAPTVGIDLVNKDYVDALVTGLDFKDSVRVASIGANINIASAPAAIDGVTLTAGDRILLKDQSTASQNGIYVFTAAASALTRSTDADTDVEVTAGMFTFVEEGTWADTGWVLSTNNPIVLGTTSLTFVQFSSAGVVTASNGLTKTGNDIQLGGALLQNTDITGAFALNLGTGGSKLTTAAINTSGAASITADTTINLTATTSIGLTATTSIALTATTSISSAATTTNTMSGSTAAVTSNSGAVTLTGANAINLTATTGNIANVATAGSISNSATAATQTISNTTTTGAISNNTTSGNIANISTSGDITNNTASTGVITNTTVAGNISNVSTTGSISNTTSTSGNITNTATAGNISNTVVTGNIENTVTTGSITNSAPAMSITTSGLLGAVYTADYSATFVANSLVSKKYVDDNTATATVANKAMTASVTTASGQQIAAAISTTPLNDSYVQVYVNGVKVRVGDAVNTADVYFADSGSLGTPKAIADIVAGDVLVRGTVLGYDTDATDYVDYDYSV